MFLRRKKKEGKKCTKMTTGKLWKKEIFVVLLTVLDAGGIFRGSRIFSSFYWEEGGGGGEG